MIKITVTPPKKPSFSREFDTVSDAFDFLEILRVYGYEQAAQLFGTQMDGMVVCPSCEGLGYKAEGLQPTCGNCAGSGRVKAPPADK